MMKTKILAAAIIIMTISGVIGFYFGFEKGSYVMSNLAAQNMVSSALGRMNVAVMALGSDDLSYSQELHRRALDEALFDLGTYASTVPYWRCKSHDETSVIAVNRYLQGHPDMSGLPPQPILDQALNFCRDEKNLNYSGAVLTESRTKR